MQDFGLVSVITPTYNCARFIEETIKSVQAQTYMNWEMLIIDDCSTDNTAEIVLEYSKRDKRIKYHQLEKNSGAAIARNMALRMAHGRWMAFLDSDDLWLPKKLESQLNFMIRNNYAFTYHRYIEISENDEPLGISVGGKKRVNFFDMYSCCWPGCLTVIYDTNIIGLIQIPNIKKNNDTALWLKAIRKANCYFLDESLAKYRRRKGSITPPDIKTKISWHYTLFREVENLNPLLASFWVFMNIIDNGLKKIFFVKRYNT